MSPEYSIQAIWAPNWEWVLAYDGRLLVVTVDDPAQIRVLVAEPAGLGGWGSTDPRIATYAVTDLDLLGGRAAELPAAAPSGPGPASSRARWPRGSRTQPGGRPCR